jgi:hypothetical protein
MVLIRKEMLLGVEVWYVAVMVCGGVGLLRIWVFVALTSRNLGVSLRDLGVLSLWFNRIGLNVNFSVVNQVLRQPAYVRPLGGALVMCNRSLLDLDWEVVINHSYREANKCADVLANIGCTIDTHMVYYKNCPWQCHNIMLADVLGITAPRSISV